MSDDNLRLALNARRERQPLVGVEFETGEELPDSRR